MKIVREFISNSLLETYDSFNELRSLVKEIMPKLKKLNTYCV
jgi:hypothetical protein